MDTTNVTLRKPRPDDVRHFLKWWNDPELRAMTSGAAGVVTEAEAEDGVNRILGAVDDWHRMIETDGVTVGHIALMPHDDGWFETQIVVGEKGSWNQGIGSAAIAMALREAAGRGIAKVFLEVRPENARAIAAYRKCGFVEVGKVKHDNDNLTETIKMVKLAPR